MDEIYKITVFILIVSIFSFVLSGCILQEKHAKPVIYLYPTEEQQVQVKLDYEGELTCTYPEYKDGWEVIAQPNGDLINIDDDKEYSYLYWEGNSNVNWDFLKGFVVKGEDTREFLQEKLEYMGLIPREYNEFIVLAAYSSGE